MAKQPKEATVQVSVEPDQTLSDLLARVEAAEAAMAKLDLDAAFAAVKAAGDAAEHAAEQCLERMAKLAGDAQAMAERLEMLEVEQAVAAEQLADALRRLAQLEVGAPVEIRSLTRDEVAAIAAEDPASEFEVLADWASKSTPHRYRKGEILRADLVEHLGDLVWSGLCLGAADPARAGTLEQLRAKARADQRARVKAAKAEAAAKAVEAAQVAVKALADDEAG